MNSQKARCELPGTQVIPQPGDFRIVPVVGWAGIFIEIGQHFNGEPWSKHDHAEVYVGDVAGDGRIWTASSYSDNNGLRPYEPIEGEIWSTGIIPLTDEERDGIVKWCILNQHCGYSSLDYFELILHHFGLKDPALQRAIMSSKRMICSQFVDRAYNEGGDKHLFNDGRWDGDVTPGDLAGLLRQ